VLRLAEPVEGAPHDPATVTVPEGKVIVPLRCGWRSACWLRAAAGEIGVWLASDERPETLKACWTSSR
jgi:uncharacterized protein (DUF934 family)